jgi:hypothetical protein
MLAPGDDYPLLGDLSGSTVRVLALDHTLGDHDAACLPQALAPMQGRLLHLAGSHGEPADDGPAGWHPRAPPLRSRCALNTETLKALQVAAVRLRLEEMGGEARSSTPQEMTAMVGAELQRWTQIVADARVFKPCALVACHRDGADGCLPVLLACPWRTSALTARRRASRCRRRRNVGRSCEVVCKHRLPRLMAATAGPQDACTGRPSARRASMTRRLWVGLLFGAAYLGPAKGASDLTGTELTWLEAAMPVLTFAREQD